MFSRRRLLQSALLSAPLAIYPMNVALAQDPKRPRNFQKFAGQAINEASTGCEDCAGLGILPVKNRKPYYHIEGQPAPKAADAVAVRWCPKCQPDKKDQELIDEQTERFKTALDAHKNWEKEFGLPLVRIETRHIVVHTQMPPAECLKMAQGFEALASHLQDLTGTMELTRTRPETYDMMCFLEQQNFEKFRTVLEKLWSVEERGTSWSQSRGIAAFDHNMLPFFYESRHTLPQRPPVHGVCFMGGRRQLYVATQYRAPRWLAEGFAEYCEFAALKSNLWHTVYNANPGPTPGDWVSQVRQLAVAGQLRPWEEQMKRELDLWDVRDYLQTFGMVAFLIQTEPKKFLEVTRKLLAGTDCGKAIEEAYGKPITKLEPECAKWLAAGGR
jgi:hypothetical protein